MTQKSRDNMKKVLVLALIIITANIFLARSNDSKKDSNSSLDDSTLVSPSSYMSNEDELINTILSRYHYKKFDLDDSLSAVIFNRYIKSLDYNRSYFLASDINVFDEFKYQFDDDIKDGDVQPAFLIFNTFKKRVNERIDYVQKLLNKGFDFSLNEKYDIRRDSAAWPKDTIELNEIWRKRVKNDALNLILAGKKWEKAKDVLQKRFDNLKRGIDQYKSEDVFQLFENSFTEAIDPHTNYMSPITSDNFKIDMSRSLEGIGAQLQTEDEYTKIVEVIPGGPAFKSKELHRDDKIVGVAQGDSSDFVDVIGWRITDVVQKIRGPKGTVVRLQIIPASEGINGTPKEVTLVRDKIKLEEQSAKDKVIDIKKDNKSYKFGVITIPAFYADFEAEQRGDKDYKSTTRDVRKLLKDLHSKHVDGVIIDLRNNGGGSLEEAIKLTGLFIKTGPVVQVKSASGSVRVEDDPDSALVYNGPLAVLVNRFSASASEIFSAAIQDYGRGLIIGEQTYGKGTVQNLIDLNRLLPNNKYKLGQLKLTIAKFYRITGGSTQHLGVVPDVNFPSALDASEYGESSEPSSLPWDQIKATNFTRYSNISQYIPTLEKEHLKRISDDPEFDQYLEDVKEYKEAHAKKFVSLNEDVRKKEKEADEEKKFQAENARRKKEGLKLLKKGETSPEDKDKNDPLLDETGQILGDYIALVS